MSRYVAWVIIVVFAAMSLRMSAAEARNWENVRLGGNVHSVFSFYQDDRGMMWIGSNSGLYNFDGYTTRSFAGDDRHWNAQIYAMVRHGDLLYLGTNNGVFMFDPSKEMYVNRDIAVKFPAEIRSMAIVGDGLWIGSLNGLYCYDLSRRQLERIEGLPHQAVYALLLSRTGTLYAGTYNGLCAVDCTARSVRVLPLSKAAMTGENLFVNALAEDADGHRLWIGTEGGLLGYVPATGRVESLPQFRGCSVKSITVSRDGSMVIGTDNGLYHRSASGTTVSRHDSRQPRSIADNVVWRTVEDRDGNLWAGTESGFSISSRDDSFEVVPLSAMTGRGDGNCIYDILRDSRGTLWLGGTNGIIRYDKSLGQSRWYMLGDSRYGLSHNRVRELYEDSDGDVWAATDGSINRYDAISGQWVNYRLADKSHRHNSNWAYGIIEDSLGRMWVGSYLGGVLIVDKDKLLSSRGTCVADGAINAPASLPNNFVNKLVDSPGGDKWLLLYRDSSLIRIENDGRRIRQYDIADKIGGYPTHIVCDGSGNVWCAYSGGLARVSPEGTVSGNVRFPRRLDDTILAMAVVGDDVWVSTNQGVWAVSRQSMALSLLPLPEKPYSCIYFDSRDHRALLGGIDEMTSVNPASIKTAMRSDSLFITRVNVNGRYLPLGMALAANGDGLSLSHRDNHVIVEFSDFNYSISHRSRYEYRVAEIDKSWILLSEKENKIDLANLSTGVYRVELRRVGASSVAETFVIRINPPWYLSWMAYVAYAVAAALLLVWAVNFVRVRNRLRIERIERDRTLSEVNRRMEFLTGVSHELKTPLSMIIGPTSKLLAETDGKLHRVLQSVYDNALKLNVMVHRALEVNRLDNTADDELIRSQVDMVEFVRGMLEACREAYPKKHFIFSSSVDEILTEVDVVKMESVVNNLLSNSCKYSGEEATVAVSMACDGHDWQLKVSDDGVGITDEEHQLIFHRLYRSSRTAYTHEGTGIGLYLVKQYVEMHGGNIEVASTEGTGTTFTVTVPMVRLSDDADWEAAPAVNDPRPKVLIVDDNVPVAAFIKDVLSGDYNCFRATNGRAGLAVCASVMPDLIIADEMMPVMSGIEMSRRLKSDAVTASIPILLLTAKDDVATQADSLKAGIDVFMPKPFNALLLKARVGQMLKAKDAIKADLRIESITAGKSVPEVETAAEKQLAMVARVIEDNIDDTSLSVAYVCEKTGLQNKQLYRLVKKYVGVSPVDYIKQMRMRKAAMLLGQGKFTVSEVMYMVGFSSSSYFSKCFVGQFGCTPRQYIENQAND